MKHAELVAVLIRGHVDEALAHVISGAKTVTCQSSTGECRLMMSAQSQALSHCTGSGHTHAEAQGLNLIGTPRVEKRLAPLASSPPSNPTEGQSDEPRFSFNLLPDNRQRQTRSRPLCRSPSRGLCYSRCVSKLFLIHRPDTSPHCPWSPSESGSGSVPNVAAPQALGLFPLKFAFIVE